MMLSKATPDSSPWTSGSQFSCYPARSEGPAGGPELSLDALRRKSLRRPAWSLSEEITFVHQHAVLGNAWARLASHLPQRDSSEVKNIFYSTTRSKGDNNRRVLSAYARTVQGREDQPASRVAALEAAVAEMAACVAAAQAAGLEGWEAAASAAEDAAHKLQQLQRMLADPGAAVPDAKKEQGAATPGGASAATGGVAPAQPLVREASSSRQPPAARRQSPQPQARAATALQARQAPAMMSSGPQERQSPPRSAAVVMPLHTSSPVRGGFSAVAWRLGRDNNGRSASSTVASGVGEAPCDDGPNSNDSSANNLPLISASHNSSLGMLPLPPRQRHVGGRHELAAGCMSGGSTGSTEPLALTGITEVAADSADHGLLLLLAAAEGVAAGQVAAGPSSATATAIGVGRRASEAAAQGLSTTTGSDGGASRLARRLHQVEEELFGTAGPSDPVAWRGHAAIAEGRRERDCEELAAAKRRRVASSDGAGAPGGGMARTSSSPGAGTVDAVDSSRHGANAADVSAIAARLRQLTAGDGLAAARLLLQQLLRQDLGPGAALAGYREVSSQAGRLAGNGSLGVAAMSIPSTRLEDPSSARGSRGSSDRHRISLPCSNGPDAAGAGGQQETTYAPAGPLLTLRWVSRNTDAATGAAADAGAAAAALAASRPPALVNVRSGCASATADLPAKAPAALAGGMGPHLKHGPPRQDVHMHVQRLYATERQQVTQAAAAAAAAAVLARYSRASAPAYVGGKQ
ncbi:hypothetical protein HYH02_004164 [Chlamydomonas schloesseri]|uniref:Myb-like domain-containing protein n=1 Tax=Chlamydomonas schloesseri TaxID=2026947 RepID=A0A836B989_9CHLO|nr:hypothetical protein HYH02_004164 [Chlamydomonas schloesseri]|eukprot:KAG2451566.1 hypothetical protein HYH02_004164 [Chlamydomonas schloesseri]